jgi:hypothetical protein
MRNSTDFKEYRYFFFICMKCIFEHKITLLVNNLSDSHGDKYGDDCILGSCDVKSGRKFPTFQRCLLPPSSVR